MEVEIGKAGNCINQNNTPAERGLLNVIHNL
jgi:hypothetical protein